MSRAAVAALTERGIAFKERRSLDDPFSRPEPGDPAKRLGIRPRDWTRPREAAYKEDCLGPNSSPEEFLDAMARLPKIRVRPIVIRSRKARLDRPTEIIFELFED